MTVVDPRERYGDLLVERSREVLAPASFEEAAGSEAATAGWVVLGFTFDDAGRVLLVDQSWADGWLVPGGAHQPGESLAGTAAREVEEETGVAVTPVRPRAVDEVTLVNERTDEATGWTTVLFEAAAETTAIDDDLGLPGEKIHDARWFEGLPDDVFRPALTRAAYERCRRDGAERTEPVD